MRTICVFVGLACVSAYTVLEDTAGRAKVLPLGENECPSDLPFFNFGNNPPGGPQTSGYVCTDSPSSGCPYGSVCDGGSSDGCSAHGKNAFYFCYPSTYCTKGKIGLGGFYGPNQCEEDTPTAYHSYSCPASKPYHNWVPANATSTYSIVCSSKPGKGCPFGSMCAGCKGGCDNNGTDCFFCYENQGCPAGDVPLGGFMNSTAGCKAPSALD
jgi:hypothetical protein